MKSSLETKCLSEIVGALNEVIAENKAFLSEIDGAIGDGDHGINMAKGFKLASEAIETSGGSTQENLKILSNTLMMKIGGSMGPLYGMFFKAISESIGDKSELALNDVVIFLCAAKDAIGKISPAKPGDKTLIDCLAPAVESLQQSEASGMDLAAALQAMKTAAAAGRDSTKEMIAKLGRSSRLGERSRGVLDAGSCSCYLILETFADQMAAHL